MVTSRLIFGRSLAGNERMWKKMILSRYFLRGAEKYDENFSQDRSLECDSNPGLPEYATEVLWLLRPALTVMKLRILNIRLEANSAKEMAYRGVAMWLQPLLTSALEGVSGQLHVMTTLSLARSAEGDGYLWTNWRREKSQSSLGIEPQSSSHATLDMSHYWATSPHPTLLVGHYSDWFLG